MLFSEWYKKTKKEEIECIDKDDTENEENDIDDEEDDEWSVIAPEDYDDSQICERLIRKMVFRNGQRVKKFFSDKENYRVQMVNGIPKEVRMSPSEIMRRKRSQKLASKKRKATQQKSIAKRSRTMTRRNASNF